VSDKKEVEEEPAYIPNSLVIKKLKFGDRRVMLLGVEEEDEDHALYVKKLLEKAEVKVACTMIAPDLPYFIKTEGSFIEEWKNFIRNVRGEAKQARFYLSPSPQILGDLCL
jgi:CO dehydrogenase/acetyl-CoA synthase epsilon subunit